jgi:hypothetical protein
VYGLAPYQVSSLWSRHVSASLPEISPGLLLPLNGQRAGVKSPGEFMAQDRVSAGHR